MILYHGTNAVIEEIDLGQSRVGKVSHDYDSVSICHPKGNQIVAENMNGKETFMVETLTRELIKRLMEEHSLSMRDAMDIVYNSKTYCALNNLDSGLYFQSPAYVYDVLEEEIYGKK